VALIKRGSYSGTGSPDSKDMGFTPDMVRIYNNQGGGDCHVYMMIRRDSYEYVIWQTSASQGRDSSAYIIDGGFRVGSDWRGANKDGYNYFYVAYGSAD
jgi:hypothetical protein